MASPKRIRDKVYRIVYDVPSQDGTRKQKTETLNDVTKREAEAILAKRIEIAKKGEYVTDPNMTMSELFDKFMSAKKRRLEATTIDRYTSLLSTYLRPELGAIKITSLRKAHLVEAYDKWQSREGRKPSGRTIKHAHDLVRATLNWAVSLDYLSTNVATKIKSEDLPKAPKPENTVLDESELRRLLAEAKTPTKRAKSRKTLSSQPWFYPAVTFAAHTGARRGEVLGLRWTDLDLDGGRVTIRQSLAQPRSGLVFKEPKNGKARTISLSANLVSILRSHRAAQAKERLFFGTAYCDQGLVFAEPTGDCVKPWNFGAAFKDLVRRAGVTKITLHDLRDTHASLLAMAGIGLDVISERLGHSSIGITADRYLTVYKERDAAAATAFERLVS